MEENKNQQGETLNEEQLEDVAGGIFGISLKCYFEPQVPTESKVENGKVFAKCKSNCFGGLAGLEYCNCHGRDAECVDKWHVVEHLAGDIWVPSPRNLRNHSGERKAVRGLKI
jgi:hypothetical protein